LSALHKLGQQDRRHAAARAAKAARAVDKRSLYATGKALSILETR
jgi:hypothetical protein